MPRISQTRPVATRPAVQESSRSHAPATTASAGWKANPTSPARQARALEAHFKSPAGAAQAAKLIQTIARKSELARGLNWEAGHIKNVKPNTDGTFTVDVQLDVLKGKGVEKNYFTAIVSPAGKVLDVPQG